MTEPRAVIFCHSTLTGRHFDDDILRDLGRLMNNFKRKNVKLAVFSNDPTDVDSMLEARGLPEVDYVLDRTDVGVPKGSHEWVNKLSSLSGIPTRYMLYVGDDDRDLRTALNTPILYLHAAWSGPKTGRIPSVTVQTPRDVWEYFVHFVHRPPRFSFTLDAPESGLHLRSLISVNEELPCNPWTFRGNRLETFNPKHVFTYDQNVTVGQMKARDMFVLHAVSSLILEGEMSRTPRFVVYPSSKSGNLENRLTEYLDPLSKTLHGFFKDDLLVRVKNAPDTSLVRHQASLTGKDSGISIENQMKTVAINPEYRGKLRGRHVLVFDDFTTTGASLEWARNLLIAAGAEKVTLLTMGKYKFTYTVHHLIEGVTLNPFDVDDRSMAEVFWTEEVSTPRNSESAALVRKSFERQLEDKT